MSTKDKAREKLLGSMRKTKEVIDDQPDTKQAHAETYTPPAAKPAAKPKPARAVDAILPSSSQTSSSNDPFQSAGRIWPD